MSVAPKPDERKWQMPSDDELMQRIAAHRSMADSIDFEGLNRAVEALGDEPVVSGGTFLLVR